MFTLSSICIRHNEVVVRGHNTEDGWSPGSGRVSRICKQFRVLCSTVQKDQRQYESVNMLNKAEWNCCWTDMEWRTWWRLRSVQRRVVRLCFRWEMLSHESPVTIATDSVMKWHVYECRLPVRRCPQGYITVITLSSQTSLALLRYLFVLF